VAGYVAEVDEVSVQVTAWLEREEGEVGDICRGIENGAALVLGSVLTGRMTLNREGSEGVHVMLKISPGAGDTGK